MGCTPHHQTTWRERNRQCGMWVACCIIKQHGGKEMDDGACGLHTASSKQHRGKEIDDMALVWDMGNLWVNLTIPIPIPAR